MADQSKYAFDYRQLCEILIREAGIRQGYWQPYIGFAFGAGMAQPPDNTSPVPSAFFAAREIGIVATTKEAPLAVNAAEVWKRVRGKDKGGKASESHPAP